MNSSPIMTIFVSSVQKEFAEERKAIKAFVSADPLAGQVTGAGQVTAQVVEILSAATVSPKTHEERIIM
jgi:hypothetical protein